MWVREEEFPRMAEYLVTGGAGFIGSNICEELVARGREVRAVDDLSTGKIENLDHIKDKVDFVECDVSDAAALEKAMDGVSYVLHQAAIPSVPRSMKEPLKTNQANVIGTLTVLECARKLGVKRVVFASSSSVYGDSETLPKREDMPSAPKSPYAVTKAVGEEYCRLYTKVFGVPVVMLRYFNVFGPRQDEASYYAGVICKFTSALLDGRKVTVYGDGEQSRDFTYISNVVNANLSACTAGDAVGEVINIGGGSQTTINELVAILSEITGVKAHVDHLDPQPGDVRHSLASIEKAQKLLGFELRVGLREGFEKTVKWYAAAAKS
jgi:nucleoside-diphosphate-sugar epimerase